MKKLPLLLPLLVLPLLGAAQPIGTVANNYTDVLDRGNSIVAFDLRDNPALGSPFLLPGWLPADVLLLGNRQPKRVDVKYDVVRQQLRVRRPQGDSVIVPLGQLREFTLLPGPAARRFVPLSRPGTPDGFVEALSPGPRLQLLKQWAKVVGQTPAANASFAAPVSVAAYADHPRYYLRGPGGRLAEVRPKRASLREALAYYPAAQAAFQARKGSIGSEAELREAVQALDPLVPAAPQ